jgi:hypothetical protein
MATIPAKFRFRRATAASWASANPVLSDGEPGYETDTKVLRIGDGVTVFTSLTAMPNSGAVAAAVAAAEAAADAAAADAAATSAALASASSSLGMAPGTFFYVPAATAPTGSLKVNGATGLLRADFPYLWSFIQGSGMLAASEGAKQTWQFGPGDGSTTFSLIDGRGEFLRAWDDGRGVDAGRTLGSAQAAAMLNHTHSGNTGTESNDHTHQGYTDAPSLTGTVYGISQSFSTANGQADGVFSKGAAYNADGTPTSVDVGNTGRFSINVTHSHAVQTYGRQQAHTHAFTSGNPSAGGGTETRPRSIAPLLCIKY